MTDMYRFQKYLKLAEQQLSYTIGVFSIMLS